MRLAMGIVFVTMVTVACSHSADNTVAQTVAGGNPHRGAAAIRTYGCGSCHTIGGIRNATGEVGPPLEGIGRRAIIAGKAPNTPQYMVQWIMNPQAFDSRTAMPNLGIDERTARDIAAYLYAQR